MLVVKLLLKKLQLKTINPVLNWFEICTLKTVRNLLEIKQRFEGKVSVPLGFVREIVPKYCCEMGLLEPACLFKQYIKGLK